MTARQTAEALLPVVRNYLDITWTDTELDQKLVQLLVLGMGRIDWHAGERLDYSPADDSTALGSHRPQELLLAYCQYARADALDEFEANYGSELQMLRLTKEAMRYAASEAEGTTEL